MQNTKNENLVEDGLEAARFFLREQQKTAASKTSFDLPSQAKTVTEKTLHTVKDYTKTQPTDDELIVKRGAFKYEKKLEEERIFRAQNLVRRVDPGPFEDPNYFAILAYQAASAEMAVTYQLAQDMNLTIEQREKINEKFSRFLIGTIASPKVNAFAHMDPVFCYTVVVMHSAIVDFIYQSAKAVIAALNPFYSSDSGVTVGADFDLNKVKKTLKDNREPVIRLYQTLENYYFKGYPRAFAYEPIKNEHGPPLELLVDLSERWIIAHEYGHGLGMNRNFIKAPNNPCWASEYFADNQATILTVISAGFLEHVPPEFPLSSANFALACLYVLRRALSILTSGDELKDEGTSTHPPYEARAENNIEIFRQFFEIVYYPGGTFDLSFIPRRQKPENHTFGDEHRMRTYSFANILLAIWSEAKDSLFQQFRDKRPLHDMWL